jgi:arginyl-tRNA synthetase
MEKISESIRRIIKAKFSIDVAPDVAITDGEHGDFATNVAMKIAGQIGDKPRIIAEKIVDELELDAVVAGPGFINISVDGQWLKGDLDDNWGDRYGENNDGAGRTVVVEYPSYNLAKPISVGHLRPGDQGWAARNLMLATGWKVITDNHIGDYGAPFGIWVVGFNKFSSDKKLAAGGIYELGRVYIAMKAELAEEEKRGENELAQQVQAWLLQLESGEAEALAYHEKFNKISLDHMRAVMKRLGISTDYELGEAFFAETGKAKVGELLKQGIAVQNDDGSVIVNLEHFGIDTPMLLQKSNGAALYATTDLATLIYREQEWHPDKVIYSVGAEQKFHFEQLFALAQLLGIGSELVHLWFGVIDQIGQDGKREKMSSRKGVVLMEELLDEAEAKARQNTKSDDMSDQDIRKISLGAIKFTDFAKDRRTNILFDWETMFSLTGFSGPYVQYAAVRVNKIISDDQAATQPLPDYDYESERTVIKKLLEYPGVVRVAADMLEPHRIATYAYELARVMNKYYEQTPVLGNQYTGNRIEILRKTAQVFKHSLNILGIEIPGKM